MIRLVLSFMIVLWIAVVDTAKAERPMLTDDPYVSPYQVLTIETGIHFDVLRRSDRPARYINQIDMNLVYGIAENFEIGLHVSPGILLYESSAPDRAEFGGGDLSMSLKRVWHAGGGLRGAGIEFGSSVPVESTPRLGSDGALFWINSMAENILCRTIIRLALGFTAPFANMNDGSVMAGVALRTGYHRANFGFLELYTEAPVSAVDDDFPLALMAGGGMGISEGMIFDIGILFGLTDTSVFPATGIYMGVTIEM